MKAVSIVMLLVLSGCQHREDSNLAATAESSMMTLNAENDVYGLVVRYHEARRRQLEYEPLVQECEDRLMELRRQLEIARPKTAKAEADLKGAEEARVAAEEAKVESEKALAALETQRVELEKSGDEKTATIDAMNQALATLETERKQLETSLGEGRNEREVLTQAEVRLRGQLEALRSRVQLLKTGHRELAKKLAEIEKSLSALDGKKTGGK